MNILQLIVSFFNRVTPSPMIATPSTAPISSNKILPALTPREEYWQRVYDNLIPGVPSKSNPRSKDQLMNEIERNVSRIIFGKQRYQQIEKATGIPWYFIGALHQLESSGSFNTHLHNGDPLTARTTHDPSGRPKVGNPPFTWEQSAIDALVMKGFDRETDWRHGPMFARSEKYNGLGYVKKGIPSPYNVAGSNLEQPGRYVADHVYDANAWSKQIGVITMIKYMESKKIIGA